MVTNQKQAALVLNSLSNILVSRAKIASNLGQSFDGDRKLYEQVGYPRNLTFREFEGRYKRQDIAKRIVNAFPDATWRAKPEIIDDDEKDTQFENDLTALMARINLYHYLRRADRMAGIGRYATVFLGVDDGDDFDKPIEGNVNLLYLQTYSEDNSSIVNLVSDTQNERFGLPEFYNIGVMSVNFLGSRGTTDINLRTKTERVHWSRVIHVPSDDSLESDVFGTPRLEAVYNRLQDIELAVAGGAEMFWRGGFPGYSFETDADTEFPQSDDNLDDEIFKMIHGLQRYIKLRGIKMNSLEQQIADPSVIVDTELKLISSGTGIPLRILTGSERGELASTQDKGNWNDRVDERRVDHAEPLILRKTIDRFVEFGIVAEPTSGIGKYRVEWPALDTQTEKEATEIALGKSRAIAEYAKTPDAQLIISPLEFLVRIIGMERSEAEAVQGEIIEMIAQEQVDIDESEEETA